MNITKHDFILYNKYEGKGYNKNLKLINSGIRFKNLFKNEASYAEAKAKAFKAEQENCKIMNDREHFNAALYETTSEVFKPFTTQLNDSLNIKKIV